MSVNNGTYGIHADGVARKPFTQFWSLSVLSDDSSESVTLALKAREWFDYAGRTYLKDNNIIVQSVTSVSNRDNVISYGYEYKNGFDITFWLLDEIVMTDEQVESIESMTLKEVEHVENDEEALIERLEKRLDGTFVDESAKTKLSEIELQRESDEDIIGLLEKRLDGVE